MVGGEHVIIRAGRLVCFVLTLEGCYERGGS